MSTIIHCLQCLGENFGQFNAKFMSMKDILRIVDKNKQTDVLFPFKNQKTVFIYFIISLGHIRSNYKTTWCYILHFFVKLENYPLLVVL